MAIPFTSPLPRHRFTIATEKSAITRHFTKRHVPHSREGKLLLASWNIANLGAQDRTQGAQDLIAHILKRFDLVAVQEVNDRFRVLRDIVRSMGSNTFDFIMSDTAGNQERLAYIYRKDIVEPTNLFGELALRPSNYPKRTVRVNWTDRGIPKTDIFRGKRFVPFDRNPFIGSFKAGNLSLTLVNVHLYFGNFQNSKKKIQREKYARRVLEIYALSKWADSRIKKNSTYDKDIILLGDMNVPTMKESDSAFKALINFGWQPVDYPSKTGGSNLGNDKTYDQMTFAPGSIGNKIVTSGVFDFDKAVFSQLWKRIESSHSHTKAISAFNKHIKHHLSDHRPLWVQLDTT